MLERGNFSASWQASVIICGDQYFQCCSPGHIISKSINREESIDDDDDDDSSVVGYHYTNCFEGVTYVKK